jgi:N6-L-threonylcarbamoyladenine synthase
METLGTTLDDAAGEAFDKVARLLELGYPGGPLISKAAEKGSVTAFDFPRAWLSDPSFYSGWDKKNFNFSFSGLKTAVLREIKDKKFTKQFVADVAASFEEAVCDVLSAKLAHAAEVYGVKEAHLAGGVSANKRLREMACNGLPEGVIMRYPLKLEYCTDNGAMVAAASCLGRN